MIDPLTARIERPGPIAPRSALAKLAAALLIALPLVLTIDVVSASVALLLEIPLLLLAGLRAKEFWTRTAVLWIAAPLSAVTIALYGATSGTVHFEWLVMRVSDGSLALAAATAVRVLAIGLPAVVLFITVDPTDLADDLAQRVKLPARFVVGALAGMRMLGLLADDWRALALARRARGVADEGGCAELSAWPSRCSCWPSDAGPPWPPRWRPAASAAPRPARGRGSRGGTDETRCWSSPRR